MMRHASVENPFLPGRAVFTNSWTEQPIPPTLTTGPQTGFGEGPTDQYRQTALQYVSAPHHSPLKRGPALNLAALDEIPAIEPTPANVSGRLATIRPTQNHATPPHTPSHSPPKSPSPADPPPPPAASASRPPPPRMAASARQPPASEPRARIPLYQQHLNARENAKSHARRAGNIALRRTIRDARPRARRPSSMS